ncbi:MAG: ABC transporter substrate-binding protein [Patescibacteria group bacterium]|nr:hypothetical protein [Patescibacteria group bacterium]
MKKLFSKIRFYFMFVKAFWVKRKRIVLVSFVATIIASFLLQRLVLLQIGSPALKIGIIGLYETTSLPKEVSSLISLGLTKALPNGQIEPGVAKSWEAKENGQLYSFYLKDNLFWHDGEEITTKNISYNFSDVSVEIVDQKTLNFHLKDPFSPLPVFLSEPIFKNNKLIGAGEYKVKSIEKSGKTIKKLVLVPVDKLDDQKIIIKFYPNEKAAVAGFKLGEVDSIKNISNIYELDKWSDVKIESKTNFNQYVGLFFNTQNDKFSDKPVRQALSYSIKKNWDNRALSSYNPSSWAFNKQVKTYEFDLENAKKLLGQEGSDSEKPPIDKIVLSTVSFLAETAKKIQEDWQNFGIETEIKFINSTSEDYEVLLISQEIPIDPDQYALWHSTQPLNLSHYKSPKLDKLLEDGRKILDQEKRKEIYFDFQRFLIEDSPAIFLYYPTNYTISRR